MSNSLKEPLLSSMLHGLDYLSAHLKLPLSTMFLKGRELHFLHSSKGWTQYYTFLQTAPLIKTKRRGTSKSVYGFKSSHEENCLSIPLLHSLSEPYSSPRNKMSSHKPYKVHDRRATLLGQKAERKTERNVLDRVKSLPIAIINILRYTNLTKFYLGSQFWVFQRRTAPIAFGLW